jgi:hypothetical protein
MRNFTKSLEEVFQEEMEMKERTYPIIEMLEGKDASTSPKTFSIPMARVGHGR